MLPPTPVFAVGDTITMHATLFPSACLPTDATYPNLRWSSGDTLVLTIDSITGLMHARKPGAAFVILGIRGRLGALAGIEANVTPP